MIKICLFIVVLIISVFNLKAQHKNFVGKVEAIGGIFSSDNMPFWIRSNQFGSVPVENASLSLITAVKKEYSVEKNKLFDWGASYEGRVNIGNKSDLKLIEGYVKIKGSIFELKAGRSREIMGLCDTILSTGSFAVSGNAPGIPNVQISIPDFYILPGLGKLVAFKGNYLHAWPGNTLTKTSDTTLYINTYLHQKSLYGRFGKPEWKWKLYGGFNHQVFWGNESDYYGEIFTLTPFKTYLYVVSGQAYGTQYIPRSKIGNHLGSIDIGFEYNFENFKISAYRQNIYDVGALYYLANIRDGLNGISLENINGSDKVFQWKKILLEFFYTKNQAGELWSIPTPSGDENYYNNYQYIEGWSYNGTGIGNPFISARDYAREGLPANPADYFINNRVIVMHLGFNGSIHKWDFMLKSSYSLNYGTFGTSEVGHTLGKQRTPPRFGIFEETQQFSAIFKLNKELKNGLNIGFITAFDIGKLYYNSIGTLFSITRSL